MAKSKRGKGGAKPVKLPGRSARALARSGKIRLAKLGKNERMHFRTQPVGTRIHVHNGRFHRHVPGGKPHQLRRTQRVALRGGRYAVAGSGG